MTNDIGRRVWEHKNKVNDGFTKKYKIHRLVYYESLDGPYEAIDREKQIKDERLKIKD